MPTWTKQQYEDWRIRHIGSTRLCPAKVKECDKARPALQGAKPESVVQHESLAKAQRAAQSPSCVTVSITSIRRKSLDPDNLTGGSKYIVDGLRYSGLISDDTPEAIRLEVTQRKTEPGEPEHTEITITRIT